MASSSLRWPDAERCDQAPIAAMEHPVANDIAEPVRAARAADWEAMQSAFSRLTMKKALDALRWSEGSSGWTCLHLAAEAGRADVMHWLQSHAAGELDTPLPATDSKYPDCTAAEIYSRQRRGTINAAAAEYDASTSRDSQAYRG